MRFDELFILPNIISAVVADIFLAIIFSQKNRILTYCGLVKKWMIKHLKYVTKRIKPFFVSRAKIRQKRQITFATVPNAITIPVYSKPPYWYNYKRIILLFLLFSLVILFLCSLYANLIFIVSLTIFVLIFIWIINKKCKQDNELKDAMFTEDGEPFPKENGSFLIHPKYR